MTCNTLFVGIDVSKLKHDVAIMNDNKKLVFKTFVIQENYAGYSYLVNRLNQLKMNYQTRLFYVGMEATADYWKNLFHFFNNQPGCIPIVINPIRTRAFAKTELRRAKTDPVNAKDIALYLVEKKPQPSYYRPTILDNIKDLDSQIYVLKKQQTMAANKLRIELCKVAPEIERQFRYIQGKQILAVLNQFPTAAAIAQAPIAELVKIRYGKKQWHIPESFLIKLKQLAHDSVAYKSGAGAGLVVQSLIRTIFQLQTEIHFLKEQIKQLYEKYSSDNADIISSIKGITEQTAIILEAYFGDVRRFNNAKQFVAFFGMNPVVNQSGKQNKRKSYLEKKGSGIVRHKLFLATLTLIREKVEPFYWYYQRLVSNGKPKLVAICATMRKLLVIIYTMIINQEKFDPYKNKNI
jgi:transposase